MTDETIVEIEDMFTILNEQIIKKKRVYKTTALVMKQVRKTEAKTNGHKKSI